MEVQLQELIEQIKKEGVETAEAEARAIVDAAKADAEKIIAEAKSQADKILNDAKTETERMTKSSEDAIRQSGRNLPRPYKPLQSALTLNEIVLVCKIAVALEYLSDKMSYHQTHLTVVLYPFGKSVYP